RQLPDRAVLSYDAAPQLSLEIFCLRALPGGIKDDRASVMFGMPRWPRTASARSRARLRGCGGGKPIGDRYRSAFTRHGVAPALEALHQYHLFETRIHPG